MDNLTLSEIIAAVDAAYQTALAQSPAQQVASHDIGSNARLRTDLYAGSQGSGFVVVATVNLHYRALVIAKQHGPETWREHASPTLAGLVAECQQARAQRYEAQASVYDLADAETKLASTDPSVQAEGAAQKASVLATRLTIKGALPKPQ